MRAFPRSARRSLGCLAAVLATTALAACSGGGGGSAAATSGPAPAWCGTKPVVFGMQDGGGLNAWSKTSADEVLKTVHQCPNVTKVLTVNAQFDLQAAISGLQGMVAQGANAIVIIPDAGGTGAELPGIRAAHKRGVAIVPWGADPGGAPGQDYLAYADIDHRQAGREWAEWMGRQLPQGGKVAFIGGPAGNAPSAQEVAGIVEGLKAFPNATLVSGDTTWIDGGWDPAKAQQAAAGLLSQHPDIAGVFSDEGVSSTGIIRAFQAAGRPLVPIASLEANALACDYANLSAANPGLQVATVSAGNFVGRIAAQLAIAKAAGVEISPDDALSPNPMVPDRLIENSLDGARRPTCDPAQPPSALLSNRMTDDQLKALTRGGGAP
ncbi:substrate-binding domain-containing protein [Pseudonocardia kujensis]|uniref:substrate-binding domain-containing protein n=1 Tax=Pseudonocardia kujensis TaxID=1128675 RepID=UPI001E4D4B12|nr:substrate-binding domain-containing protein [Pseudonocardia kujensis]MCE0764104.1 substrate-binding domain-containing protein [Pseudonocardia kujensis]